MNGEMDRPRREIARQLTEQLRKATAEFSRMQQIAVQIVAEVPSGLPVPDGQARIIKAFNESKLAFENYQRALKRYRYFVSHGAPPDE
jgi:hypothetical protein